MGDTEDTKLQLGWSEMGKADDSQNRARQKHAAWLWVKVGHHFDEKDVPFQALACRLGRLLGIQHTIKAPPKLGTSTKAMS